MTQRLPYTTLYRDCFHGLGGADECTIDILVQPGGQRFDLVAGPFGGQLDLCHLRGDALRRDRRRLLCRTGFLRQPAQPTSRRSEEHTSELQSLMRISYAVFCLKKKLYFTLHI